MSVTDGLFAQLHNDPGFKVGLSCVDSHLLYHSATCKRANGPDIELGAMVSELC